MISNYDKFPKVKVKGYGDKVHVGYEKIREKIAGAIGNSCIVNVETYPCVNYDEIFIEMKKLGFDACIDMKDIFKGQSEIKQQLKYHLGNDRVFGRMYTGTILDFLDEEKLKKAQALVKNLKDKKVLIYGIGSSFVSVGDICVYCDMARWEIQLRMRKGMSNAFIDQPDEEILKKYKLGFFVEWRVCDNHKMSLMDRIDFLIDTNKQNEVKMISGDDYRIALKQCVNQPFRSVPYFDPGLWGGNRMQEVCGLEDNGLNYAWSFDGVPEENSLLLDFGGSYIEVPAINAVLYQPIPLLGKKVFARYGAEFPIRFDCLDTVNGQNLSLQVHPHTDFIKRNFGMSYAQDESYYILDAEKDATVYLGLKENIKKDEMISDLRKAQKHEMVFEAEKYINIFEAKKHDHFLIPSGTLHCSGKGALILEISSTPYIFTFKMWDWERVGLDGLPRPVHLDYGEKVIDWSRTTNMVEKQLVNAVEKIHEDANYTEEKTGLHELESIETRRFFSDGTTFHDTKDGVNMLNLVSGREAIIESLDNSFDAFVVHYAETFIIPASVGKYQITPYGESLNKEIGFIKAYIRT